MTTGGRRRRLALRLGRLRDFRLNTARRSFFVLLNEMIGETRKLVEQHWPDIEALAQRLLVKGRVNFLETEAGPQRTPAPADK